MTHLAEDLERALDGEAVARLSRRDAPVALLEPATVRGLLRMTAEEWALIGSLWLAATLGPAWLYPAVALGLAGRFHALGVILHDAAHMPLRRKTPAIRLVEIGCGYPIASTLNAMRYHHLRHHRDSGMETDPYFKGGRQTVLWKTLNVLRGALLLPFWTVRAIVGAVASVVPRVRTLYARVFLQDRTWGDFRDSPEVVECASAEWGQLVFLVAGAALAVAFPRPVLWLYVVPVTIAGLLAARRVLIEHTHERVSDRRIETIIATTNDNHLGVLGALVLAPRNIGYHVIHHIHPQVGLQALPKLRAWYLAAQPAVYRRGGRRAH
jgi:fatty acid desaturase